MSRTSVFSKKARASDDDLSEEKSVSYVKKMEDQFKIFDPENKGFTPAMMVEILTRNHGFSQGDAEEFTEDIFDRFDTEPKDGIMIFAEFKKAWMEIKDHMDT